MQQKAHICLKAEGQKECSKQPIFASSVCVYQRLKDKKRAANSTCTCSEQHSHSPPVQVFITGEGQKECSKQPIFASSVSIYQRLKDKKEHSKLLPFSSSVNVYQRLKDKKIAANSTCACSEQHSHSPPVYMFIKG